MNGYAITYSKLGSADSFDVVFFSIESEILRVTTVAISMERTVALAAKDKFQEKFPKGPPHPTTMI